MHAGMLASERSWIHDAVACARQHAVTTGGDVVRTQLMPSPVRVAGQGTFSPRSATEVIFGCSAYIGAQAGGHRKLTCASNVLPKSQAGGVLPIHHAPPSPRWGAE